MRFNDYKKNGSFCKHPSVQYKVKKSNKFTITTDRTDNKKQSTTQEGTNNRDWYLAVEVKIKMYGKKTEKYRL